MASLNPPNGEDEPLEDEPALLDAAEAAEEIPSDPDEPMDSDPDDDAQEAEIHLQKD